MNIAERLDRWLEEQRVKDREERKKGVISPSGLGQCYRRQFWARQDKPESDPIPVETLRVFKAGDLTHELIQRLYRPEEVEVEVCMGDDVYGHADLVLDNCVKDIKSVGVFQFKKFGKMTVEQFVEEKPDYVLQVCTYAIALGKEYAGNILVCKDDWTIKEFEYRVADHKAKVMKEIETLRSIWANQVLPPAQPRLYNGKECQYCSYETACQILDGKKAF